MKAPLSSIGIDFGAQKITKRQLKKWTETGKPHIVILFSNGGIYASKGNGVYESTIDKHDTLESFWVIARNYKSGFMYEQK